jgi:hypothetical protein
MTEKEIKTLLSSFEKEIKNILPGNKFGHSSFWGGESDDSFGNLNFEFAIKQDVLENTVYQIQGEKQFIHYTSFQNLFHIINSEKIRLSDLNQLNDPKEFDFLIEKWNLELSNKEIELFKRSLFVFSMCNYTEDDDFNLWRLYGDNGKGVGIVFELLNESFDWYNFMLGKVSYGNLDAEKKLSELIKISNYYKTKGLNQNRISGIVGMLLLLHKNEIWSIEKEFRIFSFLDYDIHALQPIGLMSHYFFDSNKVSFSLNSSGIESTWLFNDLYQNKDQHYQYSNIDKKDTEIFLKNTLRLRIKKIILGYNVSQSVYHNLFKLMLRSKKDDNSSIEIEFSNHKKYFDKPGTLL